MKVAVPVHQGRFSEHFGGADAFALFAVDETSRTIEERRIEAPPEHGRGVYPVWLRQQGATVVLAGGMGPRAVAIFERHGIQVVLGVDGDEPEALVRRYLDGTLAATAEVCHEHGYHDCGHDHAGHGRGGCHEE